MTSLCPPPPQAPCASDAGWERTLPGAFSEPWPHGHRPLPPALKPQLWALNAVHPAQPGQCPPDSLCPGPVLPRPPTGKEGRLGPRPQPETLPHPAWQRGRPCDPALGSLLLPPPRCRPPPSPPSCGGAWSLLASSGIRFFYGSSRQQRSGRRPWPVGGSMLSWELG